MKDKLVSKEMLRGLHPAFRGRFGNLLIKAVFRIGGIYKVNAVYDGSKHLTGVDFANDALDKMGIIRKYENIEVLNQFEGKAFITTSNHPYGHIDGLIEMSAVGSVRSDYKMMANWVLKQVDTIDNMFIGVNPFPKDSKISGVKSSVSGIIQALEHLKEGHPMGVFPAGGISLPNMCGNVVDREWQTSPLKMIKKAQVPIVPVYISGKNSWFYQLLGHIGWQVRSAYLLHELDNKKGKTITVRFGEPISVEEQNKYKNIKDFGEFLKGKTYSMMK
jgi:1-acyl-sn-glycerol-3-phosphate acyltransferase